MSRSGASERAYVTASMHAPVDGADEHDDEVGAPRRPVVGVDCNGLAHPPVVAADGPEPDDERPG